MSVLVWIIYDIVDDRVRTKVAKECKKYGLERVQKSVFLGKIVIFQYLCGKYIEIATHVGAVRIDHNIYTGIMHDLKAIGTTIIRFFQAPP